MHTLIIALVISVIILAGPLLLFAAISMVNRIFGAPHAAIIKVDNPEAPGTHLLALKIYWDEESGQSICRAKVDFEELVRGGRSAIFSYTFEDRSAKKKTFIIPMKLKPEDFEMLTDGGVGNQARAVARSYMLVEIENVKGETVGRKIPKKKILAAWNGPVTTVAREEGDLLPPTAPDIWSVLTRVFPWRAVVATAEAGAGGEKAQHKAADAGPRAPVDFLVTKVWIEPGCIVCDACENEAPLVFQVLADTCIVRDNAPLDDAGSIKAAAEGCPVDVIKFTTVPKPAAATS